VRQQYSSYQECVDFFTQAQKTHPNLFKIESIGKTWEERDIIAVTITKNVATNLEKPALFYTGTIHAREWIGIELSLSFAKYILEHIEYDPILNTILDKSTLYMVPCANPDGFEYSRNHFSFWRKNRRKNLDGSYGVDLNRNFDVGFAKNNNMSSNVYSGIAPFSEPETAALRDFTYAHKNITIALDYHSQGNVFFPAHNFMHEDATDAIDLNLLASNMAEEIRKESGREYGVHMGKPPTHLISGSGREFYYSQGALALVAEVGSRNISDYVENMTEHIDENIPALLYAISEVNNYKKDIELPRVEHFIANSVGSKEVELRWNYEVDEDIYFELFRAIKHKGYAQSSNRITITKSTSYTDKHLKSSKNYVYYLRAVSRSRKVKSPFAQYVSIRTNPADGMFSKILYPLAEKIGYVGEKTKKNKEHFGINSLFVGISETKGECFGVSGFSLSSIPQNAVITSASISFYPMNRVSVQIENFGQWRVGQMDDRNIDNFSSFDEIKDVKMLSYIGKPTLSSQLSQGIWRTYSFAVQEIEVLQKSLKRREAYFRMEGPTCLPLDKSSQMMQWDIGYGDFSGGLTFRPKLDVSYTIEDAKIDLQSSFEYTVTKSGVLENNLNVGFDGKGNNQYGCIEFNLSNLPDTDNTVISSAYIDLEVDNINALNDLRFHLEMIIPCVGEKTYDKIKSRHIIERIGYDVSVLKLKESSKQRFVFDKYAIGEILNSVDDNAKIEFVISASSQKDFSKNQSVSWVDSKRIKRPSLVINYIKKRRSAPPKVSNLKQSLENGIIKLTWDSPVDDGYNGVIVVKNPFRVPCSPYDGQKIYGGSDNYTFDNFGDTDVHKHYAVFSYDEVPNFSKAVFIEINN